MADEKYGPKGSKGGFEEMASPLNAPAVSGDPRKKEYNIGGMPAMEPHDPLGILHGDDKE